MGATKIKMGNCDGCVRAVPAKQVERLVFGSSRYKLELCEDHAGKLRTETEDWSRYGVLEEDAPDELGDCARCWFNPIPAESLELLALGDTTYVLELCDKHADTFQTAMLAWARLGDLDEDYVHFAPTVRAHDDELGPALVGRVHVPSVVHTSTAFVQDEPLPAIPEQRPRFDMTPLLNDAGKWTWSWTKHARQRAAQRDVTIEEAMWCAEFPDEVKPADRGCMIHKLGPIKVTVNPEERLIVTVADSRYDDDDEKELRNAS
jgi:hypothetical protein